MAFKAPFTAIVSGSSQSGKSSLVEKIISYIDELISPVPTKILYCYGAITNSLLRMKQKYGEEYFILNRGFPSLELMSSLSNALLILDDLLVELDENHKEMNMLFTKGSHHNNISVIFLTQNLYDKRLRVPRINSHYLLLLKNPQGRDQIRTLAQQLYPEHRKFFQEAYDDATIQPYSYLLIDLHPRTEEEKRLSTNIFPNEKRIYYIPI